MKRSPLLLAAALALPAAPALADAGAPASAGLSAEQRGAWREVFAAIRADDWAGAATRLGALPDGPLHQAARAELYLAALSCIRSPSGQLNSEAMKSCAALARHHVGLAAPKAVLLFGDSCAKALLGLSVPQARGRWHELATHAGPVRALVTIAPRQLLDSPRLKALAWADLQMLIEEVKE